MFIGSRSDLPILLSTLLVRISRAIESSSETCVSGLRLFVVPRLVLDGHLLARQLKQDLSVSPCASSVTEPVLVVIVLYRCSIVDSSTFRSLCGVIAQEDRRNIHLLVWDNTPDCPEERSASIKSDLKSLFKEVLEIRDASNPGLVAAYNAGLRQAEIEGIKWMLTLDQDTRIPEGYFEEFDLWRRRSTSDGSLVAFVPRVVENAVLFSPVRLFAGLPWQSLPAGEPGIADAPISAINSGAFVNVPFLSSIGGYSDRFRLDYVDHWMCQTIYQNQRRICVMNISIEHQLSVNSFQNRVSLGRYQSILESQIEFAVSSAIFAAPLVLILLLPLHAIKVFLKTRDIRFSVEAMRQWQTLVRRLFRRWTRPLCRYIL